MQLIQAGSRFSNSNRMLMRWRRLARRSSSPTSICWPSYRKLVGPHRARSPRRACGVREAGVCREKRTSWGATYARPADVKSKQPDQHASDMKTEDEALPTSQIEGRSSIQTVSNPSPLILVTGAMLLLSALTMIAGGVMTTLAFVLETPGSQQFWGWMGGGLGCLLGGLGSLFGCLNSYRQMISGEDLMKSPRRTWLDNRAERAGDRRWRLLIVGLLLWSEVSPKSTRPC